MKIVITLTFLVNRFVSAAKTCPESTNRECDYGFWNEDACMCFVGAQCHIGCDYPKEMNSPIHFCKCIPKCEYDELFTDEKVCEWIFDPRCGEVHEACIDSRFGKYYDYDACQCLYDGHCDDPKLYSCPPGEDFIPTEWCECAPQEMIDRLYDIPSSGVLTAPSGGLGGLTTLSASALILYTWI